MKCNQCNKPAMYQVGEGEAVKFLCNDCAFKHRALMDAQMEELHREYNMVASQIENTLGMYGVVPKYPLRPSPTVLAGNVSLHNIRISGGNVGVLNTGTIGRIDTAVSLIGHSGNPQEMEAAKALQALTEAVAGSAELTKQNKDAVLEILDLVASEATVPKEQRRCGAMLATIANISTIVGAACALQVTLGQYLPMLAALFQQKPG